MQLNPQEIHANRTGNSSPGDCPPAFSPTIASGASGASGNDPIFRRIPGPRNTDPERPDLKSVPIYASSTN
jgi:hypothetical protein